MKRSLLVGLLAFSTNLFAMIGGDQLYTVARCNRIPAVPDLGMSVEVREGGLAGIPQVTVRQFFLGHSKQDNFFVRQSPSKRGLVFTAPGNFLLDILTDETNENGKTPATMNYQGGKVQLECDLFAIPQSPMN